MTKAKEKNNNKLVKQIVKLGEKPIFEAKRFQEWAKVLTNLGGLKTGSSYNQLLLFTIKNMLFCKWYRLSDIQKKFAVLIFVKMLFSPN